MISKELILLDIEASNKNEIIKKLSKVAYEQNKIISIDDFVDSVLEREESFSTGIGQSIAIPHGKSNSVKEPMIVFAKLQEGIIWDVGEDDKVDLIFLLGVPEERADDLHLKLLAKLSRNLMEKEFVDGLRKASNVDEIFNILSNIDINN